MYNLPFFFPARFDACFCMYENESASRLEALFSRALRFQLSDTEQDAARAQLEADAAKCRYVGQLIMPVPICVLHDGVSTEMTWKTYCPQNDSGCLSRRTSSWPQR